MVYIKNWTDFETATTDLYARAPSKVRYSVKFVPKSGELVLKVTDDVKCIKYKSYSSIILNRFESLNLKLLTQMSNSRRKPIPVSTLGISTPNAETPERGGTPALENAASASNDKATPAGAGGTAQVQNQGQGKSGGKKKKKGKK
ncbi:uncharacterized protein I303_106605 [Kwoniella dejecticola CBS 10117]|uniref:Signal recognition particle subunit SRP9 n=1 Tax=Kwoniella dejecticola CBS 10117 TaxID=1296121 RepID=A0A1A5ZU86_9TREE|nr:signal recognition particle subunit SRP9 [Kwoniella dejecticola CBS 10117]OBR81367.1 signal recognition particle subunit SRP9 [Kwoniella dejecticola CBS 10117]